MAAHYGIDQELFMAVARCESGLNPNALNPKSGTRGLFQFMPRTWARNAARLGYSEDDVWNPVANAAVAALMWSGPNPQYWQWECWYRVLGLPVPTPQPTPAIP